MHVSPTAFSPAKQTVHGGRAGPRRCGRCSRRAGRATPRWRGSSSKRGRGGQATRAHFRPAGDPVWQAFPSTTNIWRAAVAPPGTNGTGPKNIICYCYSSRIFLDRAQLGPKPECPGLKNSSRISPPPPGQCGDPWLRDLQYAFMAKGH